jgi:hypothetical protein
MNFSFPSGGVKSAVRRGFSGFVQRFRKDCGAARIPFPE